MKDPEMIPLEATVSGTCPSWPLEAELANGHRLLVLPPQGKQKAPNLFLRGRKILIHISPYDLSRGRIVSPVDAAGRQ